MTTAAKVIISVLSLVMLAAPIMACAMPASAMTAAERNCCKRMAYECGKGMAKSHSCCQTTTVPDRTPAIKSSSDVDAKRPAMIFVHALAPMLAVATMPESGSTRWAIAIHSPPVSAPLTVSVLRI
jgi:hypothetical protein